MKPLVMAACLALAVLIMWARYVLGEPQAVWLVGLATRP